MLYSKYADNVYGVILQIVKNENLAEEVLQNTILKVWNKIETYNSNKSALFTWMMRIARNSAIDQIRLKQYSNQNKTDSIDTTVLNNKIEYQNQNSLDAEMLMKKLDQKYRDVLELVYLKGYSQSDVSKQLDIPLGTVKTRLRSAIKFLREELKNEKSLFIGGIILLIILLLQ